MVTREWSAIGPRRLALWTLAGILSGGPVLAAAQDRPREERPATQRPVLEYRNSMGQRVEPTCKGYVGSRIGPGSETVAFCAGTEQKCDEAIPFVSWMGALCRNAFAKDCDGRDRCEERKVCEVERGDSPSGWPKPVWIHDCIKREDSSCGNLHLCTCTLTMPAKTRVDCSCGCR